MKYKTNKYIIIDVESDGPLQGENSLVCFGAVAINSLPNGEYDLSRAFKGFLAPYSSIYDKEALSVSGYTRQEHENFPKPEITMKLFEKWCQEISENGKYRLILLSDNNGYDAPWINWYTIKYLGKNPFGWSSRRIGDLFCGLNKNLNFQWKKYRKTKHTHDPVDDAKGNAEAFIEFLRQTKIKI